MRIEDIDEIRKDQEKVAEYFGIYPQLEQTIEECAELIVAIRKYLRHRGSNNAENLEEEIADVWNMLYQITYLLGNQEKIHEWLKNKVDRTINRIRTMESEVSKDNDQP